MNIVMLTTKYLVGRDNAWLTNELALHLNENTKHKVTVVALSWNKDDPPTGVAYEDGVKVVRVKAPEFLYKKKFLITALKILLFPRFVKREVTKNVSECDLLIANTPCITTLGLPNLFKRLYNSKTYLILWDFFPYYLKDLNLVRNNAAFKLYVSIEGWMYRGFDRIGCMTERNREFLLANYKYSTPDRVSILRLWDRIKPRPVVDKHSIRKKYALNTDSLIVIYGGAMSVVQDLKKLLLLAKQCEDLQVQFVLLGAGTERAKLESLASGQKNVKLLPFVSREEYAKIIAACDIGFISLASSLTVPSFPSKSIDYFKVGLPILAAIDHKTDFGDILENEIKAGYFVSGDDISMLRDKLITLLGDAQLRYRMGDAGRAYYEKYFSVDAAASNILNT